MSGQSRVTIEPLGKHHDRAAFSCGKESLDYYLKRLAGQDGRKNMARVFVAIGDEPHVVAGYYSLSSLSIDPLDLPDTLARKLPRYPNVPAALIGRLAVDKKYQGRSLGALLLANALKRIAALSAELAIYAAIVEPIDAGAADFYRKHGFLDFPNRSDRLLLPMNTMRISTG